MSDGFDPKALALAGGVTWAASAFLLALGAMWVPGWQVAVKWLGQFYLGYAVSVTGAVVGAVWAFFDVFIGLYVFGWLYVYFKQNPPL